MVLVLFHCFVKMVPLDKSYSIKGIFATLQIKVIEVLGSRLVSQKFLVIYISQIVFTDLKFFLHVCFLDLKEV